MHPLFFLWVYAPTFIWVYAPAILIWVYAPTISIWVYTPATSLGLRTHYFIWVYAPATFHLGLCTHHLSFGTMHPPSFIWVFMHPKLLFGFFTQPQCCLGYHPSFSFGFTHPLFWDYHTNRPLCGSRHRKIFGMGSTHLISFRLVLRKFYLVYTPLILFWLTLVNLVGLFTYIRILLFRFTQLYFSSAIVLLRCLLWDRVILLQDLVLGLVNPALLCV
jgi:hypothetical protein